MTTLYLLTMVSPLVIKKSLFGLYFGEKSFQTPWAIQCLHLWRDLLKTVLIIVKDVVKYFATLLDYVTMTNPFVPFIELNKESFGQGFDPTDLLSSDPEKKSYTRNLVRNITKMMCKENKARTTQNFENAAKHLPSDRVYTVCSDRFNYFSNSRLILD